MMMTTLRTAAVAATALLVSATGAFAEAQKYDFDASHSQILFKYNHLGFSTTYGMYSGFDGVAMLDFDAPEKSSVSSSWDVKDMFTGWERREGHFFSPDLINADANPTVSFKSTSVKMTGEKTADITGDLTFAGTTKEVVLATTLNKTGDHPRAKKPWAGFDATTTLKRSDFGVGMAAPFVSDEVEVTISVELSVAE